MAGPFLCACPLWQALWLYRRGALLVPQVGKHCCQLLAGDRALRPEIAVGVPVHQARLLGVSHGTLGPISHWLGSQLGKILLHVVFPLLVGGHFILLLSCPVSPLHGGYEAGVVLVGIVAIKGLPSNGEAVRVLPNAVWLCIGALFHWATHLSYRSSWGLFNRPFNQLNEA